MSLIKGMQKKEDSEKGRKHNNNSKQFINVRQNKKLAKNKKISFQLNQYSSKLSSFIKLLG